MTDVSKNTPTTTDEQTAKPIIASDETKSSHKAKGSGAKGTTKAKPKAKRARPRRRGADSDDEDDAGDGSDDSLTSASEVSDSEDDEDDHDEPASASAPGPSKTGTERTSAAFADVSSTTPAAWADETPGEAEEISFDDFNRGEATRGAKRGRGRGRGGVAAGEAAPREKKVFTEEQTRKYEEKKAKMKAKKLALKEARKKEQEEAKKAAASNGGKELDKGDEKADDVAVAEGSTKGQAEKTESKKRKAKAKKDAPDPVGTLAASTASLSVADKSDQASTSAQHLPNADATITADTAAPADGNKRPPTGPRANNREPRIRNDPKVTPRNGNFWTHDQRQPEAGPSDTGFGSGGFRGRGMANGVRGGIRGRGRGAFGPGQFGLARGAYNNYGSRGQELTGAADDTTSTGEKDKTLEMDKLEAELERQKQKQREAKEAQAAQAAKEEQTSTGEDGSPADDVAARPAPVKENKWGHEGFESQQAVQQFQANRAFVGRGRGRASFPRGSYISRLPFHPANLRNNAPSRPSPLHVPTPPTETNSTQPDADALMGDAEAPKVNLPGTEVTAETTTTFDTTGPAQTATTAESGAEAVQPTSSVSAPAPTFASIRANAPSFVQQPQPVQANAIPFVPSAFSDGAQSPQPFLGPGSENGSIASNGAFPPAFVPNAAAPLAVNHTGEYYPAPTQQQQTFYPRRSFPQQAQPQPQQFYPQSYSPDLFHQQHPSRHGSFSSQGYVDGRASPYPQGGNYTSGGPGTAFFVPARPSKISIRAPTAGQHADGEDDGLKRYPSIDHPVGRPADGMNGDMHRQAHQGYYAQGYNPYAAAQMGYGGHNGMNGMGGMNGMNGMNGMGGMNGQGWVAGAGGYPAAEYGYEYGY